MTIIIASTPALAEVYFTEYYIYRRFAKEPFCSQISMGNATYYAFWRFTMQNALRDPIIN